MNLFSGVFVATITPFDTDGVILWDALDEHIQFLVRSGVHGLVPCGTTGEASMLTTAERRQVIERTKKLAGSLPVIAGCGSNSTAVCLEMIREARQLGCAGALVVTPYYTKPTPAGLIAHYHKLADEGGLPIVLYNVPSRTNIHLSVETVTRLCEHPNIVGIKEASGQYGYWLALSQAMDLKEKALLAGDDDGFAVIRALGGSGIISASANVVPAQFVKLYDLTREGNWEEAFRQQKKLYPLIHSLFMETNPAPIKYALQHMGRGAFSLRLPLVSVGPVTEAAIAKALKSVEAV